MVATREVAMFDVGRIGWIFILRGVLALLFALLMFNGLELKTQVFAFGLYCLTDGVFTLGIAFRHADEGERPWWALLVGGIVNVLAGWGAFALLLIQIPALALLYLMAAWAVVTGAMWIVAAIYLRKHVAEEWMLAGSGVLTVVFGGAIALFSGAGALALMPWIGAYALVYGLLLIALGVKLRTWMKEGYDEFQHRFSPASQYYVH
jgi:uncharacterized membrane protein HdeD (DUF308 family)